MALLLKRPGWYVYLRMSLSTGLSWMSLASASGLAAPAPLLWMCDMKAAGSARYAFLVCSKSNSSE